MHAWQVFEHGEPARALRRIETPPPRPQEGQLRVRVAATALGLPDVLMCRGSYPLTPTLPFTPGQELVGEVIEAAPGAPASVGERVMGVSVFTGGDGGFAQEALLGGSMVFPAPAGLSDAEAAGFVIPYHTAYVGLVRRAGLREGEVLLVLGGAGGTGSAAIQLGRSLGARVIATAGGAAKAEFCESQGAEVAIDYRERDIAEAVMEATGGRGADVVYDPVGGEAFVAGAKCIAHEGRLLLIGFASGRWGQPKSPDLVFRNYSVLGAMPGSGYTREFNLSVNDDLMARCERGEIRVPVQREFPFEELPKALEEVASRRALGKIVLRVSDG